MDTLLSPAFQHIFDSILRVIGTDSERAPGTRSIKARQGSFTAHCLRRGFFFHEHGESTSDPSILMGEPASHLLLLDHFSERLWNVPRRSMYGCNLSVSSIQYRRRLRRTHRSGCLKKNSLISKKQLKLYT